MLYSEERKQKIMFYIQEHGRASVQELSETFEVSESTIRRDLKELEEETVLRRTHGGAISLHDVNFEPTFQEKEDAYRHEKIAVAKEAAKLIKDGETILLDSGTTTYHLIKELKSFSRLTVVTNSVVHTLELQHYPGIEVFLLGGTLRKETQALVGPLADQALSSIRVDKAFLGTNGLDIRNGLTTPNMVEATTKRKMIAAAKQVVLLTDHSKINKVTFAKFADLKDIDLCIIDQTISESVLNQLLKTGLEVIIA